MNLESSELISFLLILVLFLAFAHSLGFLFEKYRQPRVIGEILAGLILGSTLLRHVSPNLFSTLFVKGSPSWFALAGLQELGLVFLMFCSGFEIQWLSKKSDIKLSVILSLSGLILPIAFAIAIFPLFDLPLLVGTAGDFISTKVVFAIAVAVTSIPVISRILMDLGVLDTRFARIILTVALFEDLILYGFLSALLTKFNNVSSSGNIVKNYFSIQKGSIEDFVYNFTLTVGLFIVSLIFGPKLFARVKNTRMNLLFKGNVVAFIIVFLFIFVLFSLSLGIAPIFGAFIAGMIVAREKESLASSLESIRSFSFSTFIPLYFVVVGFKLDLVNGISWKLLIMFLLLSSLAKVSSVVAGALTQRISIKNAVAYGFSLNARGGPGIVLATLTFNAGIISEYFFSALVITAILTSFIAGTYLRSIREDIKNI